jgi:hypothetical protein
VRKLQDCLLFTELISVVVTEHVGANTLSSHAHAKTLSVKQVLAVDRCLWENDLRIQHENRFHKCVWAYSMTSKWRLFSPDKNTVICLHKISLAQHCVSYLRIVDHTVLVIVNISWALEMNTTFADLYQVKRLGHTFIRRYKPNNSRHIAWYRGSYVLFYFVKIYDISENT